MACHILIIIPFDDTRSTKLKEDHTVVSVNKPNVITNILDFKTMVMWTENVLRRCFIRYILLQEHLNKLECREKVHFFL